MANHGRSNDFGKIVLAACEKDDSEKLEQLLRGGHVNLNDTDADGYSYLILSAYFGSYKCVRTLLDFNANPNWLALDGSTALVVAVQAGHHTVVDLLLQRNAKIHVKGGLAPLFFAAQEGNPQMVRKLVAHRANPNVFFLKATPLFIASQENHPETVRVLLELKADPNLPSRKMGATSLIVAVHRGLLDITQILLAADADVNWSADDDTTPLLEAVDTGNEAALRMLLERGARTDARRLDGRGVVDGALKQGNTNIIRILMDHGVVFDDDVKPGTARTDSTEGSLASTNLAVATTPKRANITAAQAAATTSASASSGALMINGNSSSSSGVVNVGKAFKGMDAGALSNVDKVFRSLCSAGSTPTGGARGKLDVFSVIEAVSYLHARDLAVPQYRQVALGQLGASAANPAVRATVDATAFAKVWKAVYRAPSAAGVLAAANATLAAEAAASRKRSRNAKGAGYNSAQSSAANSPMHHATPRSRRSAAETGGRGSGSELWNMVDSATTWAAYTQALQTLPNSLSPILSSNNLESGGGGGFGGASFGSLWRPLATLNPNKMQMEAGLRAGTMAAFLLQTRKGSKYTEKLLARQTECFATVESKVNQWFAQLMQARPDSSSSTGAGAPSPAAGRGDVPAQSQQLTRLTQQQFFSRVKAMLPTLCKNFEHAHLLASPTRSAPLSMPLAKSPGGGAKSGLRPPSDADLNAEYECLAAQENELAQQSSFLRQQNAGPMGIMPGQQLDSGSAFETSAASFGGDSFASTSGASDTPRTNDGGVFGGFGNGASENKGSANRSISADRVQHFLRCYALVQGACVFAKKASKILARCGLHAPMAGVARAAAGGATPRTPRVPPFSASRSGNPSPFNTSTISTPGGVQMDALSFGNSTGFPTGGLGPGVQNGNGNGNGVTNGVGVFPSPRDASFPSPRGLAKVARNSPSRNNSFSGTLPDITATNFR